MFTIVVVVLLTANVVTELKLKAVCKSTLTSDPSAVSVKSTIGITIVDAEKSTPAPKPPCDGNNWLIYVTAAAAVPIGVPGATVATIGAAFFIKLLKKLIIHQHS